MQQQNLSLQDSVRATTGERLEELRRRLGLSRREVAELAKVTPSRVWTVERSPLAQERETLDARRIVEALEKFSRDHPNGKPTSSRPRTTTATLRNAVKVALDGVATLAATEDDSLRRAGLKLLHQQITAAAFEGSERK